MFKENLSLVIPVFNEAESIAETLDLSVRSLSKMFADFEIIVVNDGSTDTTARIISEAASGDPRIRVIENPVNSGSGFSLWKGMKQASKELVLSNFADRPFDLDDLSGIIPLFREPQVDFVVVARSDRSANSLGRKLTSWVNYLLIRTLFGIGIGDFQFVQVYRRSVLENIDICSTGTFVPPELMIRLVSRGSGWKQVRCHFYRRDKGYSKCGNPREYIKTLKEMLFFRFAKLEPEGN